MRYNREISFLLMITIVPMSESNFSTNLTETYRSVITEIIEMTIQGKIRSKEQVYQKLVNTLEQGSQEIFEHCLTERFQSIESEIESLNQPNTLFSQDSIELKKAKLTRILRALQSLESEYQRFVKESQEKRTIEHATQQILRTDENERFFILLQLLDPNHSPPLNLDQLQKLSQSLQQMSALTEGSNRYLLISLAEGIRQGLTTWKKLEGDLISWIYQVNQNSLGFGGETQGQDPWKTWLKTLTKSAPNSNKKPSSSLGFGFENTTETQKKNEDFSLLERGLESLATGKSFREFAEKNEQWDLKSWTEFVIILQLLQRGLITWFEQQPYSSKWGKTACISMFLTFTVLWCQLSNGCSQATFLTSEHRNFWSKNCFLVMLQILRNFAQKSYFPLYGGIFALFSQEYLQDTLDYLDAPLKEIEGTQEKARILTLLGVSQRIVGHYEAAIILHEEALEIARKAQDYPCEIANLNHLSRIHLSQKNYHEAINESQRALILARQQGDQLGEANGLVNLGYSEVFSAQKLEQMNPDIYETAINYLQQGLTLSEKLNESQSLALCYNGLGIAYLSLQQEKEAIIYLQKGAEVSLISGDRYLQGLNFTYQAEAFYALQDLENSINFGSLAMYILEQISAPEWRQSGGLMRIIQGQLGTENFEQLLSQSRSFLVSIIGIDGYDYLGELLAKY